MRTTQLRSLLALVLLPAISPAQFGCRLEADINKVMNPVSSSPRAERFGPGFTEALGFARCHGAYYFTAFTALHGRELWKTDGTPAGTVMVKDINPGKTGSLPHGFFCCGAKLFFTADDGVNGRELWVSLGTAATTTMVKDIHRGALASNPNHFECLGNTLFFAANDGIHGIELWRSDGTARGTTMVKDISARGSSFLESLRRNTAGNAIYFRADDWKSGQELWKTDGTASGTVLVKDINPGAGHSFPSSLVNFGGATLFTARTAAGNELWKTDGTGSGTVMVKDINPGAGSSSPGLYGASSSIMGSHLYFTAYTSTHGAELWRTDGTSSGTTLVKDTYAGRFSGLHSAPRVIGSGPAARLYFAAQTQSGIEPWVSDGTAAGTRLLKDLQPSSRSSVPRNFHQVGNRAVFTAFTDIGNPGVLGLFVTDGTSAGTRLLKKIDDKITLGATGHFTALSNTKALFVAYGTLTTRTGYELWETDGTVAGTRLFKDLAPGGVTDWSMPTKFHTSRGQTMFFSADDGLRGRQLWKTDARGTSLVKHIPAYWTLGIGIQELESCWTGTKQITVFTADDGWQTGWSGLEPWVTDGTSAGTFQLKDINPGPKSSRPRLLTSFAGRVYFVAEEPNTGAELWSTDGTRAGTKLLQDATPGALGSAPLSMAVCEDKLLVSMKGELWATDGTASGTKLLKDIYSGPQSSTPFHLTTCGNRVCFAARTNAAGGELWISDGTAAGTVLLKDIATGAPSSDPLLLTWHGDLLYFVATTAQGRELWRSDLTPTGTFLLKDIHAGSGHSDPHPLTGSGGRLFFSAKDPTVGRELWVTDGTTAGTRLVRDLVPGTGSSSPRSLVAAHDGVFFLASDGSSDFVWYSDGTANGTKKVCPRPGGTSFNGSTLVVSHGKVYLADGELYSITGNPATVEVAGESCGKTRPTLSSTHARIGKSVTLRGRNAPTAGARLLLLSAPQTAPAPLPTVVAPGCLLQVDPAVPGFPIVPIPGRGARWNWTLPVPNDPVSVGVRLMMQAAHGGLPVVLTNGVQVLVGG